MQSQNQHTTARTGHNQNSTSIYRIVESRRDGTLRIVRGQYRMPGFIDRMTGTFDECAALLASCAKFAGVQQ